MHNISNAQSTGSTGCSRGSRHASRRPAGHTASQLHRLISRYTKRCDVRYLVLSTLATPPGGRGQLARSQCPRCGVPPADAAWTTLCSPARIVERLASGVTLPAAPTGGTRTVCRCQGDHPPAMSRGSLVSGALGSSCSRDESHCGRSLGRFPVHSAAAPYLVTRGPRSARLPGRSGACRHPGVGR
jgi:hypothetical protein